VSPSDFPPSGTPASIPQPAVVPASLVPDRRGTVAFLSHAKRDGDWILPRLFRAVAFMGNLELDLTRARVGAGTSRIELVCVMGSITVMVPPEIRIECDGDPLLGSFDVHRSGTSMPPPGAPLVTVTGKVIMGSIEVRVIDPDAPGWLDRLRAHFSGPQIP
jgi:hypothetical protein